MKHVVKGLLAITIFTLILGFGWSRYREFLTEGMQPTEGTKKLTEMENSGAPDFELNDLAGKPVKLSQFKDQVVILSFWASWCDPCVEEFPSMVKLTEKFKGKVVLLAVSADRSQSDIESFLKPYGALPEGVVVVWDKDRKVAEQYGTEALPESFIMAPGLKIFRKVIGSEDWYSAGAIKLFEEMVSLKPGEDPKTVFGQRPETSQ